MDDAIPLNLWHDLRCFLHESLDVLPPAAGFYCYLHVVCPTDCPSCGVNLSLYISIKKIIIKTNVVCPKTTEKSFTLG